MALIQDLFSEPIPQPMVRPFLKWAGGKSRLLNRILPALPFGKRLLEPFVGSAAVAINAPHAEVLATDRNADLISVYRAIQANPEEVIRELRSLFVNSNNDPDRYYVLRSEFNSGASGSRRAALFIYLNRHGFNGLCRYNASGEFNVPFGRYKAPSAPIAAIRSFVERSQSIAFWVADFEELMAEAAPGDAIYCDPPYVPLSPSASFTSYAKGDFGPADQERLAGAARSAAARGATVAVSNHDTPFTRELYRGATISFFPVQRMISAKGDDRWAARELLAVFEPA